MRDEKKEEEKRIKSRYPCLFFSALTLGVFLKIGVVIMELGKIQLLENYSNTDIPTFIYHYYAIIRCS